MQIGYYNATAELVGLILMVFLLFLIVYSNPRKTSTFAIILCGVLISIVAIITQLLLFYIADNPEKYSKILINILCVSFLVLYFILLLSICGYIVLLSTDWKKYIKRFTADAIIISIVYMGITMYLLITNELYEDKGSYIIFTTFTRFYITFGLIDALMFLLTTIINRKKIPRVVTVYIAAFIPLEVILLVVQLLLPDVIFSSITYVIPLLTFYILFHSNPYDEKIGCQNQYSFDARFQDSVWLKRKFMTIFISFPQFKNTNYAVHNTNIENICTDACRKMEYLHNMVHIYRLSTSKFILLIYEKDPQKRQNILNEIEQITQKEIEKAEYPINYRIVALCNNPTLKTAHMLRSMSHFLYDKMANIPGNICYFATDNDYREFYEQYQIEQLLLDIRNQSNLDDDRVLCYAQPIYSVKDNAFRTAEALMRLTLNGRTVYPDKFIGIAERNNCVHILTCIMLNKVCKAVYELNKNYSFDAITINCSSSELSKRNLYEELITIINNNHIDPTQIRLELTESAMFDDFDTVLYNMQQFNQSGIQFYLDDFGTGYSNLERIIGCPFYTIKFDKSLLYKSMDDSGIADIVTHMADVFKKQGFVLLVEGVEDDAQNSYSIDHGFDYIQGYKYAKPQPIMDMVNYFTKKKTE